MSFVLKAHSHIMNFDFIGATTEYAAPAEFSQGRFTAEILVEKKNDKSLHRHKTWSLIAS